MHRGITKITNKSGCWLFFSFWDLVNVWYTCWLFFSFWDLVNYMWNKGCLAGDSWSDSRYLSLNLCTDSWWNSPRWMPFWILPTTVFRHELCPVCRTVPTAISRLHTRSWSWLNACSRLIGRPSTSIALEQRPAPRWVAVRAVHPRLCRSNAISSAIADRRQPSSAREIRFLL